MNEIEIWHNEAKALFKTMFSYFEPIKNEEIDKKENSTIYVNIFFERLNCLFRASLWLDKNSLSGQTSLAFKPNNIDYWSDPSNNNALNYFDKESNNCD